MKTALTVITTAILTAIAFLFARQNGWLGNIENTSQITTCPIPVETDNDTYLPSVEELFSCVTPGGNEVVHGDTFLSFKTETGSKDAPCESRTSICNNGEWVDNKIPYTYESCTIETDVTCNTPSMNDKEEENIEEISENEIEQGSDEIIEKTTNTSPSTDTYTTPINTGPVYARCDGPFGGIREHGKSSNVYLHESVPFGQVCQMTSIVCGFGSLRYGTPENIGDPITQQIFATCTIDDPATCNSACGIINHGERITTYKASSVAYADEQSCKDLKIRSTCDNGKLSPPGGTSCECKRLEPLSCTAPNGQIVAHEGSLTLYQYPEIQAIAGDGSDTCIRQRRQCLNGVRYDYNNNTAEFTFEYPTCTVLPPIIGDGESGEGVPQE